MKTTNGQIADLLAEQTYAERMSMARTLQGFVADWMDDETNAGSKPSDDEWAFWLECLKEEHAEDDDVGEDAGA